MVPGCAVLGVAVEVLGVGSEGAPVDAWALSMSTSPNLMDTSCCCCCCCWLWCGKMRVVVTVVMFMVVVSENDDDGDDNNKNNNNGDDSMREVIGVSYFMTGYKIG